MAARKYLSSESPATGAAQRPAAVRDGPRRLWLLASSLLGALLVWSLLAPQDAASVFNGSAIPPNLLGLALAVTVAVAVAKGGMPYPFGQRQWILVGGCLLWLVIATIVAGRDNNPRVAWNGFWQIMALGGCYFSARGLVVGPRSRQSVVLILLVGSVALASQGLHQVWVEFPADRARYLADPEGEIAKLPGLEAPPGSAARQRFEDRLLHSSEPYAAFALANSLAVVLSGGLVLLVGLSFASLRGGNLTRLPTARLLTAQLQLPTAQASSSQATAVRSTAVGSTPAGAVAFVALAVAATVLMVCWFLTRSRVAYPALLVGGAYWVVASRMRARELRRFLPWVLGLGGLGLVVGTVWLIRNDSLVLSEAPKSLSYRLEYWFATLAMLRDHWLFGIGLGNFQSYYPIYKLPLASETIADPHNWLLDIWVSLSVPLGVVIVAWLGKQLWPRGTRQPTPAEAAQPTAPESAVRARDDLSGQGLLWGAGAGGAMCAVLLSLLNGMDLWLIALSWLPAVATVSLLKPVLETQTSGMPVTARAAAITMLTCLLVSGSWQATGIAVPLLLLLVLGDDSGSPATNQPERGDASSRWRPWSVVWLPAFGLLLFLFQCWRPTTASWSLMQQAMVAASPRQQLELTEKAAAADPLNSEPLRWRAQLLTVEAVQAPQLLFSEDAQRALAAIEAWLAMDSVKSLNWEAAGSHTLELAAQAKKLGLDHEKFLAQALSYYSQGLVRYPSNIGLRAQLAATLAIADKWPEADRELQIAEQLNEQMPHLDKKLQSQQLWMPLLPEGAEAEFGAEQPWIAAEPLAVWLRKTISADH